MHNKHESLQHRSQIIHDPVAGSTSESSFNPRRLPADSTLKHFLTLWVSFERGEDVKKDPVHIKKKNMPAQTKMTQLPMSACFRLIYPPQQRGD